MLYTKDQLTSIREPFSPQQLAQFRKETFDPIMIQAVNECLIDNYGSGQNIMLRQGDIIERYIKLYKLAHAASHKDNETIREDAFEKGLLDFEKFYVQRGWRVEYDKPGFNESYEPTYTFSPKKNLPNNGTEK